MRAANTGQLHIAVILVLLVIQFQHQYWVPISVSSSNISIEFQYQYRVPSTHSLPISIWSSGCLEPKYWNKFHNQYQYGILISVWNCNRAENWDKFLGRGTPGSCKVSFPQFWYQYQNKHKQIQYGYQCGVPTGQGIGTNSWGGEAQAVARYLGYSSCSINDIRKNINNLGPEKDYEKIF